MKPVREIRGADITAAQEASFWSLVRIDWRTGCWLWTGNRHEGQVYARFKVLGTRHLVHRLSYALAFGYTPVDCVVRHSCDTPLCVGPHHLSLGTPADNAEDRVVRGRQARGERSGTAKLTEVEVRAIKNDARVARVIGAEYGVGKSTIQKIRSGVNWSHIE